MDRKELKKLALEGEVNIDPNLVDDLLDETVQKLLAEYTEKVRQRQVNASVIKTIGAIAETCGVSGASQLSLDISNNPEMLKGITSGTSKVNFSKYFNYFLLANVVGCGVYLTYSSFLKNCNDVEINNGGTTETYNSETEKPKKGYSRKRKYKKAEQEPMQQ